MYIKSNGAKLSYYHHPMSRSRSSVGPTEFLTIRPPPRCYYVHYTDTGSSLKNRIDCQIYVESLSFSQAMEVETRKRRNEQNYNDTSSSLQRVGASEEVGGDLGDDIMSWLSMDDEAMSEVMNLLDDTTTNAESEVPVTPVKFIDNPYSSLLIFQSSSSYVTINGNEESCGSSFSDSESSVMVSIDMGGIANKPVSSACGTNEEACGGGLLKGGEMEDGNFNGSGLYDYNAATNFLLKRN